MTSFSPPLRPTQWRSSRRPHGTTSPTTPPRTRVNSQPRRSKPCVIRRPRSAACGSLPFPRKNTAAAHEVFRRFLDAVDPAPHARELVAFEYFGDGARGQIADDVLLVVVLAAKHALPFRRDVQMLQRAGAEVVAS